MRQHTAHISEIESVVSGKITDRDEVVVESWKRCIGEHNLDPARATEPYIVPDRQLREHRERSERLIGIARDSVEDLFRQIAGHNYVLLLTDELGVTVDYFGDEVFKSDLQRAGLYLGSEWSESRAGTCGVGSCIESGRALTVHQGDHFDSTHTPLSCTAAPIYNSQGILTAVLDISLLRSPSPKISQNLALHLVQGATRRIEQSSLMNDMRSEWVLCLSRSPAMVDVDPEASLALDGSGRIIGMTHSAAQLLAVQTQASWRHPDALLGKRIQHFFHATVEDLPRLTRFYPSHQRQLVAGDNSIWYGHAIDPSGVQSESRKPRCIPSINSTAKQSIVPEALAKLSGGDRVLDKLLSRVTKLSKVKLPILIHGETGVGKEYMARAIHNVGRPSGPFVAINCAAIPEHLIEGELFGHAAGAYTGASRHGRAGLIESAEGGTLFLDEIGDMPINLQARLLRFLSEGEITRVGAVEVRRIDVRVLAASHHNLPNLVETQLFRADLYYRLNGVELRLPPLRHREDFSYLVQQIVFKHEPNTGISEDALKALMSYDWPGNLRELDNVIQLALALKDTTMIELQDLPRKFFPEYPTKRSVNAGITDNAAVSVGESSRDDLVRMQTVIAQVDGNMTQAAKVLGINRSTLYRRLKRLQ